MVRARSCPGRGSRAGAKERSVLGSAVSRGSGPGPPAGWPVAGSLAALRDGVQIPHLGSSLGALCFQLAPV